MEKQKKDRQPSDSLPAPPADSPDSIPPDVAAFFLEQLQIRSSQGPIPPPEVLEQFGRVMPELPALIVDRWKKQGDHRMEMEKLVVRGDNTRANWGLAAAAVLALTGLIGGIILGMHGYEQAAAAVAGTPFLGLVVTHIYGTYLRSRERADRRRE